MKAQRYTPHIFSLCALLVFGNAAISMPFYEAGGFLFVIISAVLSSVLIFLINLLTKWGAKNKVVFYITAAIICAAAIYGAAIAFFDYIGFLTSVQMPHTNSILPTAVLLGVVVFLALNNITVIYKYSLFVSVIGGIMIAICFVGGIKNFDFTSFKISFSEHGFNIKDFLRCFSSLAVIPFFVSSEVKNAPAKPLFLGTAVGFFVLVLCLAQSIFTLGFANDISYPYLKAVSVISSGSLFTRLDGFVYFLFFITVLVKIAVCIKTVSLIIKRLKRTKHF